MKKPRAGKVSDKARLDLIDRIAKKGTPGGFFLLNPTDGALHRMDRDDNRDRYEDICSYGKTVRQAIDAAIRSEAKARGRK